MNAYADWWLAHVREQEQHERHAYGELLAHVEWLGHVRPTEEHDGAPVGELEDAELRDVAECVRAFSETAPILLVVQLRYAAWELQEELNRRADTRRLVLV